MSSLFTFDPIGYDRLMQTLVKRNSLLNVLLTQIIVIPANNSSSSTNWSHENLKREFISSERSLISQGDKRS